MLENNRVGQLLLRFPEDVQVIFKKMIPAYQRGYVDYVYQTDKIGVQGRRIKNLVKSFRRMDYFYVMPLDQELALEIADWTYPAPFDFYDARADAEDYAELISPEARGDRYFAVIRNGELMGYFCLEISENQVELGLGMKPSWTGQGHGAVFYQTIENHIKANVSNCQKLVLSVAAFNERARKLYAHVGFSEVATYVQATNGGHYDFVKMEKKLVCD